MGSDFCLNCLSCVGGGGLQTCGEWGKESKVEEEVETEVGQCPLLSSLVCGVKETEEQ